MMSAVVVNMIIMMMVVVQEDFEYVLSKSKPTVATRELEEFEKFTSEFGSDGS